MSDDDLKNPYRHPDDPLGYDQQRVQTIWWGAGGPAPHTAASPAPSSAPWPAERCEHGFRPGLCGLCHDGSNGPWNVTHYTPDDVSRALRDSVASARPADSGDAVLHAVDGSYAKGRYVALPAPELRPPPGSADGSQHWVMDAVAAAPTVAQWRGGVWRCFNGWANDCDVMWMMGYRYLGPCEWPGEPAAPPVTAEAERIAALEAENTRLRDARDHWKRETERLVNDPVSTISAEDVAKHYLDDERHHYGLAFNGFAHARLTEVIRAARLHGRRSVRGEDGEIARLTKWLRWMSVSSGDAVLALRGDPAPELMR